MGWAALHPSSSEIALFVLPMHASLCFLVLLHCSELSKSSRSCSTNQKLMTHDLIIWIEDNSLVSTVNSLISTFGDGLPVSLCLWLWPVNSRDSDVKGTGQWTWSCWHNFIWTAHIWVLAMSYCRGLLNGREGAKDKDIGWTSLLSSVM